ncbi:hypothetical protein RB594_004968 [Gaeumannomyces avenae]
MSLENDPDDPSVPLWLREIRRRERHRPIADRDDALLLKMVWATRHGHLDRFKEVLEALTRSRGQVDINMYHDFPEEDAPEGETLLHTAVRHGHPDVAALLISLGADLEASVGYNDDMYTPLHKAVLQSNVALVRLLLDSGADVHARWYSDGGDDGTATVLATYRRGKAAIDTLDILLDYGLDINDPYQGRFNCNGNRLLESALSPRGRPSLELAIHLIRRGVALSQHHYAYLCEAASNRRSPEGLQFLVDEVGRREVEDYLMALLWLVREECYPCPAVPYEMRLKTIEFLISRLICDLGPGKALKDLPEIDTLFRKASSHGYTALAQLLREHEVGVTGSPPIANNHSN